MQCSVHITYLLLSFVQFLRPCPWTVYCGWLCHVFYVPKTEREYFFHAIYFSCAKCSPAFRTSLGVHRVVSFYIQSMHCMNLCRLCRKCWRRSKFKNLWIDHVRNSHQFFSLNKKKLSAGISGYDFVSLEIAENSPNTYTYPDDRCMMKSHFRS